MNDLEKVEQLLANGYFLSGEVIPLSRLTPESIAITIKVFSIQMDTKTLLDLSNRTKSLIMLKHPSTGHQIEIITLDKCTISRANEQLRYQREPIGTLIRARCAALGGSSSSQRIFHLDRLVASLEGLRGWKFKLGDSIGTLEVIIRLESTDRGATEESLNKLQRLLDCLAVSQEVGFHIQHYSVVPIPRFGPTVSFGLEERMLPPITLEEIGNIETTLSSTEASVVAEGLNQAYIENCMPSRLSRLWATVEDVFGGKPEPLLKEEEVNCLIGAAKGIESLGKDSDRLGRLEEALSNPGPTTPHQPK